MSKLTAKIRTGKDPVLHQVCQEVQPGDRLDYLIAMQKACKATGRGAGLAAPQIGVPKRAIYINGSNFPRPHVAQDYWMLNPVIIQHSEQTEVDREGCLSFPGVSKWIRRYVSAEIEYNPVIFGKSAPYMGAQRVRGWFHSYESRVQQHEINHLDGICLVGDESFPGEPEPQPDPQEIQQVIKELEQSGELEQAKQKARQEWEKLTRPSQLSPRPFKSNRLAVLSAFLAATAFALPQPGSEPHGPMLD
jgi:peptide deformylase